MNRRVKRAGPVIAKCLSCPFEATGSTWRPVRRRLFEHTAQRHSKVVA